MSLDPQDKPDGLPREPVLDSRALNFATPASDSGPQVDPSRAFDTSGAVPAPIPAMARPPEAGQIIGGYRIVEQVGSGGFSVVFRAVHLESGEIVALKLPRVSAFVEHLRREALISARFQDPQVVGIREVRLDHEPPFLAMPFIDGANLDLPDASPEPREIVLALWRFRAIAEVVARLHDAGIAHGDLKPGNIRFDSGGKCHLLDLGIARQQVAARQLSTLRASVVSVTGEKIAGTLEFMAPETMSGEPPRIASDVYALGVILHHLLCGRPPAFGVSPGELNPFLPPRTSDLLRQMLQHDANRRIACAGALLPAIDGFIRAEERCLARRNGHLRRRVFAERMRTLARGARFLVTSAVALLLIYAAFYIYPTMLGVLRGKTDFLLGVLVVTAYSGGWLAVVLGMTTINAWILGIPEKTYKNRTGHPLWNFMMQ